MSFVTMYIGLDIQLHMRKLFPTCKGRFTTYRVGEKVGKLPSEAWQRLWVQRSSVIVKVVNFPSGAENLDLV
jgi:hypothetical protein